MVAANCRTSEADPAEMYDTPAHLLQVQEQVRLLTLLRGAVLTVQVRGRQKVATCRSASHRSPCPVTI